MPMVYCRGCAKEIHDTAIACPQCGAPQAVTVNLTQTTPPPTAFNCYAGALKKYAVFSGRARRKEYWMFLLISFAISFTVGFVEGLLGAPSVVSSLYSLAVLIPTIAVGVRRLHDTDRSGWWLLLPIVNIIFLATDSDQQDNRFGPGHKVASNLSFSPAT